MDCWKLVELVVVGSCSTSVPLRVTFTERGACCLGGSLRLANVSMSCPVIGDMLMGPVGGAARPAAPSQLPLHLDTDRARLSLVGTSCMEHAADATRETIHAMISV